MYSSRVFERLTIAFLLVGYGHCRNFPNPLYDPDVDPSAPATVDPSAPTTVDPDATGFETDEPPQQNGTIVEFNRLDDDATILNGTEFEYQADVDSAGNGTLIIQFKHLGGRAPLRPCNRNERRVGGKCKMIVKPCKEGHIVVDGKCRLIVPD